MTRPESSRQRSQQPTSKSFLVLPENRLAYTAVTRLARMDERPDPPLVFLHGASGSGKSHLARYCVRLATQQRADCRLDMLSSDEFMRGSTKDAATNNLVTLRDRLQNLDLLILEDVHLLRDSEPIQQILLAGIDALGSSGGRILMTSCKSPGELSKVNAQLRNRCIGGACLALQLPEASSREKLLRHFADYRQIALPTDCVGVLAKSAAVSARELEAMLLQLEMATSMQKRPLDLPFVRQFLKSTTEHSRLTLNDVARAVTVQFHVSLSQLRSQSRQQGIVLPRQVAMYLARKLTNASLEKIGIFFGNRDHATVVYACNRLQKLLPEQAKLRQELSGVLHSLQITEPLSN